MPPDDFDFALMRVRLSLKRSLTVRFVFDGLFSASGLGVYRSSAAHPVLGPICCRLVLRSSTAQPVLGPMLLRFLCSRVVDSGGQPSVLVGQVLCPQSLAVFRVSDDLLFVSDS